jgi:hypothetical protein
MRHRTKSLALATALALVVASNARASSPDTPSRAFQTAEASDTTTICEGGSNPGAVCQFDEGCNGGGTCTGVANVRIAARGTLTIIADTKPVGIGWSATTMPGCTNPSATTGDVGSCETRENATLTLLLEFTLNGKKYAFGSTYTRLPEGTLDEFDTESRIDNWTIDGETQAGWNEDAVESTVAHRSLFTGQVVKLRWGGLPPAAEAAVGPVLGKTANQRVVLSRTDDVPICTDATPCKHSSTNTQFSDHSDGTDPLGTVRRYKVDIAVVGP